MSVLVCTYAWFAGLVALSGLVAFVRLPGRGGRLGALEFIVSAPALHIAPVLLMTLLVGSVAALSAYATRCGQIGLASAAVAIGLLLALQRRADATAITLDRALQEAFGAQYSRMAPARKPHAAHPGINPFNSMPGNVERLADLSYGDAGTRHLLDIYRPRDAPSGMPVLLALHGGAWVMGHKRIHSNAIMFRMASSGWLVVAINYRLGPRSRFPEYLVDVKRAIAWIRAEAVRYGGDPAFIIACGESAGGHLAALTALTENRPEYQPGFEHVDTSLRGAVPIYARFDFTDRFGVGSGAYLRRFLRDYVMPAPFEQDPHMWDAASPIACVHPDMPPLLVLHGTHDSLISVEEADHFVHAARAVARAPVAYAALDGAQHAYELSNSRWAHPTVDAILAFGELLHADYVAARDPSSQQQAAGSLAT